MTYNELVHRIMWADEEELEEMIENGEVTEDEIAEIMLILY